MSPKSLLHSAKQPAADMAHMTELVEGEGTAAGGADDEDDEGNEDDHEDGAGLTRDASLTSSEQSTATTNAYSQLA